MVVVWVPEVVVVSEGVPKTETGHERTDSTAGSMNVPYGSVNYVCACHRWT